MALELGAHGRWPVARGMDPSTETLETLPGPSDKAAVCDDFPVGTLVRLTGLQKAHFNHHIGRVVAAAGLNGRVGISLHGVVWPAPAGTTGCSRGSNRRRGREPAPYDPIAVKPSNLRKLPLPSELRAESMLGCVPRGAVLRLLGEGGWGLPEHIAVQVAELLRIQPIAPEDVTVSGCSSTRGDFPLSAVLGGREDEWWISKAGTMPGGVGREYLEFDFGQCLRRVSFLGMRIPPLPHGPLSVRDFHLFARCDIRLGQGVSGSTAQGVVSAANALAADSGVDVFAEDGKGQQEESSLDEGWLPVSPEPLHTLDRADLQEFAFSPPLETTAMRLVCIRNAAAGAPFSVRADCVGLFQVCFA